MKFVCIWLECVNPAEYAVARSGGEIERMVVKEL